ncbi:hypothetical protein GCM10011500_40980 [Mucilaginibacter rubeus]|nr:hypothetical protein GCM10011500_40980 [Mucilaginibacter rubeus]
MYHYFYIEAIDKAKIKGTIAYITPNTFLTLGSKLVLRKRLQGNRLIEIVNVGYVFDSAFVDTTIVVMNKEPLGNLNYSFKYKNAINSFKKPETYSAKIELYRASLNNIFFTPNSTNLSIYHRLNPHLNKLYKTYWELIEDTKSRQKNISVLNNYCDNLNETDLTFLGLITEGAQGLVTGNNSKYLAIICNSEEEELKILRLLVNKLLIEGVLIEHDVNLRNKNIFYELAEKLKKDTGKPSLFGKFFLYKTVRYTDVIDFESLSLEEQLNGCEREVWVNYNRGNENGYKWYVPHVECIKWHKATVKELREATVTNSRWQGANYYNTSGFGWVDYFTNDLKGFFIEPCPYSKNVVKMHSVSRISDKYILALLNSKFGTYYIKNFITTTHTLQINDGKLFPIITDETYKKELEDLVDKVLTLKSSNETSSIKNIEKKINSIVYKIYNLTLEETRVVDSEYLYIEK